MAWEQRGNIHYYYRKVRQGDRVFSEYVGSGDLARACADLDELERHLRRAERAKREGLRALDAELEAACGLIRALTYAALLSTGHHTHKGQWRKKRHD
jgi:hypothetical protein